MTATRRVVVHGHFYQPPREDPWLEDMPRQDGAAPWHDWNEKIERECYRAIAAARVQSPDGRISRIRNLYGQLSYDVGPTLFEWMERHAPATYRAMIDADRAAVALHGVGNAMAQPYHHVILPLASRRDKVTEVRWGIADFQRRFGRLPEGMWLPETAVDDETLDVLAQEGIQFTVLAPGQVKSPPARGRPGRYTTANGRTITICVYDGTRSHGVAFGQLLVNARLWKANMMDRMDPRTHDAVTIATDGETYGHHHKFSEMALAWLLDELSREPTVEVTTYPRLVADWPPAEEITLVSPSAWSCTHGVERWQSDCGCRVDGMANPSQAWRAPLRAGLNTLRDALDARFAEEGASLFRDPWAARDAYGAVVGAEPDTRLAAVMPWLKPGVSGDQAVRARELLEMARDTLRMFTSCAWFFDDLGGVEPVQTLRYACRALDLAGPSADALERALRITLRTAVSNDPAVGTGEDVWVRQVRPLVPAGVRLAAGAMAAATFVPQWPSPDAAAHRIDVQGDRVLLTNRRTGRRRHYDVTVQRRGSADVQAYVRPRPDLDRDAPDDALLAGIVPVSLEDYPERERLAVRDGLRTVRTHELARRLFGEHRLATLALAGTTLVDATVTELQHEVDMLASPETAGRVARTLSLCDLLELMGHHIPFEAQTRFARVVRALPVPARAPFADAAQRLGFDDTLLTDETPW
jgi:hypothetical protein